MTDELKKLTQDWVNNYGGQLILASKNKWDEEVAVIYKNGTLYLAGPRYKSPVFAPKMYVSLQGSKMYIQDMLVKDINIGNGSILMKALFRMCEKWGVREILGYMSPVDDDHKERRNYFYQKHNFSIRGNWAIKRL